MASARVRPSVLKMPRTAEVRVTLPGLRMPRIAIHAEVFCLYDDDHAGGLEPLLDRVGDLRGVSLLHLWPLGVQVCQAGKLGQTGDATAGAGNVADCDGAMPGHQVVLAHRVERGVFHENPLVVVLVECRLEYVTGIGEQAGEDLPVRAYDSSRCVAKTLTIWVLADCEQQLAHSGLGAANVHAREREHLGAAHPFW
jgi:hypothetical protein